MKWGVTVLILHIQHLFQKKLNLMFEFSNDLIIVFWAKQMLKLSKNILILSWVKLGIFFVLKLLKLEEKLLELFSGGNIINLDV
jgi:hypothetical protein